MRMPAPTAILIEELPIENRKELRTLMSHALVRASAGEPIRAAVEKVVKAQQRFFRPEET